MSVINLGQIHDVVYVTYCRNKIKKGFILQKSTMYTENFGFILGHYILTRSAICFQFNE